MNTTHELSNTRFRKLKITGGVEHQYKWKDDTGAPMQTTIATSPLGGKKIGEAFRSLRIEIVECLELAGADLSRIIPSGLEIRDKISSPRPEARLFAERHLDSGIQKLETPWLIFAPRDDAGLRLVKDDDETEPPTQWSRDTTANILAISEALLAFIEDRVRKSLSQEHMFAAGGK